MHEQLVNAITMIPGIIMALIMGYKQIYHSILSPIYAHIGICVGSIIYHMHSWRHGHHPHYLRLDLFCQNLCLWLYILHSPMGVRGLFCMLPFSYISLCLADLKDPREKSIATMMTAVQVCIAWVAVTIDEKLHTRLLLTNMLTFCLYAMKYVKKNRYTHSLFHIMLHVMNFYFFDILAHMRMRYD
jgi:hypothetical protein